MKLANGNQLVHLWLGSLEYMWTVIAILKIKIGSKHQNLKNWQTQGEKDKWWFWFTYFLICIKYAN